MTKKKSPAPKSKPPTDWEAIADDYRAGVVSIREMAKIYDISEAMIRKRAKAEGWERFLADRVRSAVAEKMLRADAEASGIAPPASSHPQRARTRDEQIVEAAATTAARIILSHRVDLTRLQEHRTRLLDILQSLEAKHDKTDTERMLDGDKPLSEAERYDVVQAQAQILEQLARVTYRLIPLERQAYALDAKNKSADAEGGTIKEKVAVIPAKTPNPIETRPMNDDELAMLDDEA